MNGTITAIYENGVLRPLTPLSLPEHTRVELQIVTQTSAPEDERRQVRQVLMAAGVIRPQPVTEAVQPVSEERLTAAAQVIVQSPPTNRTLISQI